MEFTEVRIICNTRATPMVRVTLWLQLLLVVLILRQSASVSDQCSELQEDISSLERDKYACRYVLHAAKTGDVNTAKMLFICSNENCTSDDENRDTPLIYAAFNDHVNVVRVLLDGGANVDRANDKGNTALHIAAYHGRLDVCRLLLDWGAKVDPLNNSKYTPLHWAAWKGHLSVVKLLVERGADVSVKSEYGETASDLGRLQVCRSLLDAVKSGDVNFVMILFKFNNENCTDDDNNRNTPLAYAATYGHVEVVRVLLEGGANVDSVDANRHTALQAAAYNGHLDVCRLLLDWGAKVNTLDKWKNTPLHEAAWRGHLSVVKLLVERGADVSVKNLIGNTACDLAWRVGNKDVADWLHSVICG